ncbi:sucrase ferredoxin [Georgenia subflava]|uniref:Sucrase ferredoxin n=1 Tax=Georgenia subflava TaxID=1622177 RepID=A0A6N7EQQ0_9MICO|nr:sucrase ferredoxin [Georgenia subflava]MPV38466.1 sucrase ferredoxin [Georgenia subflava]
MPLPTERAAMTSTRPSACSRLSLDAGEPLAGSASTANGYLVVEHGGPWGAKVLRDAPFADHDGTPVALGEHLARVLAPLGVTTLLARRTGSRHGIPFPATVMLVAVDAAGGHGARTTVGGISEILSWDLPELLARLLGGAVPAGWDRLDTQYLVCTHARRDACCGELGRPLVAALGTRDPGRTWEVSHLGGHRLAASALVLPDGVVYGRLGPDDVPSLVSAHTEGAVLSRSLRGRAALPQPAQAAEIALRRHTGIRGSSGLRLDSVDGAEDRTTTHWTANDGTSWRVVVHTERPDAPEMARAAVRSRHRPPPGSGSWRSCPPTTSRSDGRPADNRLPLPAVDRRR